MSLQEEKAGQNKHSTDDTEDSQDCPVAVTSLARLCTSYEGILKRSAWRGLVCHDI